MIGDMKVDETIVIQLDKDTDKEKLLSLMNGKYVIFRLKASGTVLCADEEGVQMIYGELDKKYSASEKATAQRILISNAILLDEEDISFSDIEDSIKEAGLGKDRCISVEVTEHILEITDLPY